MTAFRSTSDPTNPRPIPEAEALSRFPGLPTGQAGMPWRSGVTPVNMHESFAPYEAVVTSSPSASERPLSPGLLARLAAWVKSCADHYAATAAYEELSRLSNAELKRRGLSRDILARDL
jgi:hypothetical protein